MTFDALQTAEDEIEIWQSRSALQSIITAKKVEMQASDREKARFRTEGANRRLSGGRLIGTWDP